MTIFELDRTMVHIFYFKGIFLDQVQPFSKSFLFYISFSMVEEVLIEEVVSLFQSEGTQRNL